MQINIQYIQFTENGNLKDVGRGHENTGMCIAQQSIKTLGSLLRPQAQQTPEVEEKITATKDAENCGKRVTKVRQVIIARNPKSTFVSQERVLN